MTQHMTDAPACQYTYTINNYTTKDHIPDEDCKYRIQGYEIGESGTPHIQGYVCLKKKIRWARFQKIYPTITWFEKSKGTPYSNYEYCSKDKAFDELGLRPTAPKQQKNKDTTFSEALAASTVREGLQIIKEKRPRDFLLHGEAIERNLKKAKLTPFTHTYLMEDFTRQPLNNLDTTTLLTGPSNTGKTHYACAHFKNPLVISHIDTLKSLSPDHDGIIFDDMSFKHWAPESVIHLIDQEFDREIHIRYGTTHIPAHTPKIFTHNTDNPFYKDDTPEEQKIAIERRLERVNVINKLF